MIIRKSQIIKACTIIILLIMAGYSVFNLISVPGMTGYDYRITTFLGFAITILLLINTRDGWNGMSVGFHRYIIAVFLSMVILAIFTIFTYSRQSIPMTLRPVAQYLVVIWAVPVFYWLKNDNSVDELLEIINIIAVIWCLLILSQEFYYVATGEYLFSFLVSAIGSTRGGYIRISTRPFTNFSILYCFWKFYSCKDNKKIYHLCCFFIMIAASVFVAQGRVNLIVLALSLSSIIMFDDNRGCHLTIKILYVSAIIAVLLFTGFIQDFILNIFTQYSISVNGRAYGYLYYLYVFLGNPFFGFGLLKDQEQYGSIYSGPEGLAFTDDVGFIGQLALLGVFSLVIIVSLYIHFYKQIRKVKRQTGEYNIFMIAIFIYLIGSSATMIIFDSQRIVLLPIIIAIFEYYSCPCSKIPSLYDNTN